MVTSDDETRVSFPGGHSFTEVGAASNGPPALPRGTMIDRYVLLNVIGHGGMGIVYSAYDPELDRSVAVKLVRSDRLPTQEGTRGRYRMLREARALAKLAHPNVVRLYDAGLYEDDVYLAMEMATGATLREWLQTKRRSWHEIVDVFIQAGRGLAAAHAAGLVHRDIKPGNILVGDDGRVCLLDFGLARGAPQDGDTESASRSSSRSRLRLEITGYPESSDQGNTQTGLLIGTPAYMAPEIMLGKAADPRSDQFSLCVALYEALYGQRPFMGETRRDLLRSVLDGRLTSPAPERGLPQRLRRIVLRGLSTRPEDRYRSVQALLADLSRNPARTHWRIAMGVGFFALGVASTYALFTRQDGQVMCSGDGEHFAGVWDEARKNVVAARFHGSTLPYANETWERVVKGLDAYRHRWSSTHQDSCEATLIRGEQSQKMLELRQACLDTRLLHVRATINALAVADDAMIHGAVMAVAALPPLETCSDRISLQSSILPADDENDHEQQQLAALHEQLAKVAALEVAGEHEMSLRETERALVDAQTLDRPLLVAEAQYRLGRLQFRAGLAQAAVQTLQDAQWLAEAHRHDEIVARARIELVHVLGHDVAQFDEALHWARQASASITRIGSPHELVADRHDALGTLYLRKGEFDRAASHYSQALDHRTRALGHDHHAVATQLANLATVAIERHDFPRAVSLSREALQVWERTLGPRHPRVGKALNSLGVAEMRNGNHASARHTLGLALQITEALGTDHPAVAEVLNNLGDVAERLGDDRLALAQFQRALEIRQRKLGADHPEVGVVLTSIARVQIRNQQLELAAEALQRARSIFEATVGHDHLDMAQTLLVVAMLEAARGRHDQSATTYEQAIHTWQALRGRHDPRLVGPLVELARELLVLERTEDAVASLERALQLPVTPDQEHMHAAGRFALARVIARERPDRAHELALHALQTYVERGPDFLNERHDVEVWLTSEAAPSR